MNKATIEEVISSIGAPDYVIPRKYYKGILDDMSSSEFTFAYDHLGCEISFVGFNKKGVANNAIAPAFQWNEEMYYKSMECGDFLYQKTKNQLSKFSCLNAQAHNYCKAKNNKKLRDTSTNKSATLKSPERLERIQKQFSNWDGSHIKLEAHIKSTMHDPSSYKHVQTQYHDSGDYILVATKFRGKNIFGAQVLNNIRAKVDINGNILQMLDSF